jgi:hypothetical protein
MIYKEYRDNYYYFDVVKMVVRFLLVIIINVLDFTHLVIMMSVVLILYYLLSLRLHPFIYYRTQAMDLL